jgi:hypothetical protein
MSYSPAQMFPGAFDPDVAFLGGKFKDSSAPGVYDGSPLSTILFNQEQAFWDAVMIAGGETYNNTEDVPDTSQLFKALQQSRQVEPSNNQWNGFFDPAHQSQLPSPAEYPDPGGTAYSPGDEWSLGNFASSGSITSSSTGITFTVGAYKLFTYTPEQLALIDETKVPVYIVDETGKRHFLTNATNGVNVTKPDSTTLKVELTNAIFAELGITKVWEFFVTDGVGYVPRLSPDALKNTISYSLFNSTSLSDKLSSRDFDIEYTNDSVYPRRVYIVSLEPVVGGQAGASLLVDGNNVGKFQFGAAGNLQWTYSFSAIVKPGEKYELVRDSVGDNIAQWFED